MPLTATAVRRAATAAAPCALLHLALWHLTVPTPITSALDAITLLHAADHLTQTKD